MGQPQLLVIEGERYLIKFSVVDPRREREPYEDCKRDPRLRELFWSYHTQTLVLDKKTGMKRFFFLDSNADSWRWNFEEATFNAGEKITYRLKADTVKRFVDVAGAALFRKLADLDEFPLPSLVIKVGRKSKTAEPLDIDIDELERDGILDPDKLRGILAA